MIALIKMHPDVKTTGERWVPTAEAKKRQKYVHTVRIMSTLLTIVQKKIHCVQTDRDKGLKFGRQAQNFLLYLVIPSIFLLVAGD